MKKVLLSFLILPVTIPSLVSSSTTVKNIIRSEAEGGSVEVNSSTTVTVNGKSVTVQTDKPGEIEIKADDNQVEIKAGKDITPTIIENQYPASKVELLENTSFEVKKHFSVSGFIKDYFRNILKFFKKKDLTTG